MKVERVCFLSFPAILVAFPEDSICDGFNFLILTTRNNSIELSRSIDETFKLDCIVVCHSHHTFPILKACLSLSVTLVIL